MQRERPASVDAQRQTLRESPCQAPVLYGILMVRDGSHPEAARDEAVLQTLHALGHTVFDLETRRHPQTLTDGLFTHEPVSALLTRHAPRIVVLGHGVRPSAGTTGLLRREGIATIRLDHAAPGTPVAAGSKGAGPSDLTLSCARSFSRADLLKAPLPSPEAFGAVLGAQRTEPGGAAPDTRDHDDGEDRALAAAVLEYSGMPALPGELVRRAFARVAAHHLLEHRIESLFAGLRRGGRLPQSGSTPGAVRPRTVILSGYYGAGNLGDELLLEVLLTHLRHAVPEIFPVVAAADPAAVERVHGVQAFRRGDLTAAESYSSRSSSVILGPGGHWHDYSIGKAGGLAGMLRSARVSPAHMAQLPLLVSGYGGTVHIYGMGAGPLADPSARAAVHLTGQLARSVSMRDAESLELIRPMSSSWPAEVVVAPDVVYGLTLPTPVPTSSTASGHRERSPYLAVNLRPWTDGAADRRQLQESLFEAARAHGLSVVGLPLQSSDVPELEAFAAAAPEDLHVELLSDALPLPEFLAVLQGAEALVSMRLHANLLMHRLRRPALGLVYDPKVRSHFAQLGRQDFAHDLGGPPAHLRESLEHLLTERELPQRSQEIVAHLEAQAAAELHRLGEALRAEPRRDPDPAWLQHLPPRPPPRPAPRPRGGQETAPWWPAGETMDVGRATVTAGNPEASGREVAFRRDTTPEGDRVSLVDRAPRRGDAVQWSYMLDTSADHGIRVELSLRQKYAEKTRFAGFLVYSVAVDGRTLFTHDVTTWNARHALWIGLRPVGPSTTVTVRLEAVKDCTDRNWGLSTPLTVERIRVQPWAARQDLVWGSSSPYAVPAVDPTAADPAGTEVPAAARWSGRARRLARRIRRRLR